MLQNTPLFASLSEMRGVMPLPCPSVKCEYGEQLVSLA